MKRPYEHSKFDEGEITMDFSTFVEYTEHEVIPMLSIKKIQEELAKKDLSELRLFHEWYLEFADQKGIGFEITEKDLEMIEKQTGVVPESDYTLEDLVSRITPENMQEYILPRRPRGKEVW